MSTAMSTALSAAGWIGGFLTVAACALLVVRYLSPTGLWFQLRNTVGTRGRSSRSWLWPPACGVRARPDGASMLVESGAFPQMLAAGPVRLDTVEHALVEVAAGRPVVVVDDEGRENEGDLVMAADAATPDWMAFIVRHTSGLVCVPMTGAALDRLGIPPMAPHNQDRMQTAFAVSVDARMGVTTGISARDRAQTARLLADPQSAFDDFVRPGHLLPLRAREGGVLIRPGHTEAAVDLARLAGRQPAGVIAELVEDRGGMRRADSCRKFADEHGLAMISIEDLREYRRREDALVSRIVATRLPTRHGVLTAVGYVDRLDVKEHLALVAGLGPDGTLPAGEDVLVRVHSECLTGEVLGSTRCDCGPQLDASIEKIAAAGHGVVVYLRGHEGRGIGLLDKLRAYALQDEGRDTVDANVELGVPVDAREYRAAAEVLKDLGVQSVHLLTNNPAKVAALRRHGIGVSARLPLVVGTTPDNISYLGTKRDRMGHHLLEAVVGGPSASEPHRLPTGTSPHTTAPPASQAEQRRCAPHLVDG